MRTDTVNHKYSIEVLVVVGRLLVDPNNTMMIRHCQLPC